MKVKYSNRLESTGLLFPMKCLSSYQSQTITSELYCYKL